MLLLTVDRCVGFFSSTLEITVCHSYCPAVRHQSTSKKLQRNKDCQIIQFLCIKFRRTLTAKPCHLILVQKRSYSYLGNNAFNIATLCKDFADLHHKVMCACHAVVGKRSDTLSGSHGKPNTLKNYFLQQVVCHCVGHVTIFMQS